MANHVNDTRKRIGIITGSGPDAGLDMWQKILKANKAIQGDRYTGDLDAPEVVIMSIPALGLSMELEKNNDEVWHSLSQTASKLAEHTDYYAIACNTLNYYQPQLEGLGLKSTLVSFPDVVSDRVLNSGLKKVALLGAKPVTDLGDWSPYRKLLDAVELETPVQPEKLHQLIYDVKAYGGDHPAVIEQFTELLSNLEADVVLLACTELPLIPVVSTKDLIDVTDLVAAVLAERSLAIN
ncbi:aspartate/glutamate racemase family protein [Reinekea marinisedimentorum]|uniref:Aspartate racemase n=1 Tax=Reinekea marinisedimentorum TaxID=230495 RepID=A0A4R3I9Y0_9GAMM|nr:aspartate/glutamate racemase family protein [Reinekea marinisedimentorum]TCS42688.1 aspartate racemase [Reinekea marinisedimentorum]